MRKREEIRWGCVQPLTGGMYLGAERAIGHPAEWIISYPGLTDLVTDKEGNVIDAANERNIVNYLTDHNRMPKYYTMNRTMTQNDEDLHPILTSEEPATEDIYNDMDLVVGVPVCAGLSMASMASTERKNECNCQMVWMEKYVLKTIHPKVYIFENAPTLISERGDSVRAEIEVIAKESGYSVVYYKTDTKLHHNCQKRPRTFVMFFRNVDGKPYIPNLQWERDNMSVEDFFDELYNQEKYFKHDPMEKTLTNEYCVDIPLAYIQHLYGDNWRDNVKGDIFDFVANDEEEQVKFIEWLRATYDDEKLIAWFEKYLKHINDKHAEGLGFWSRTAKSFKECLPACMYKNVPITVHHKENRLYNMREWMWAMGHPADFIMIGEPCNYFQKMGQNVPVNTAKWITKEALRVIENWGEDNVSKGEYIALFDNCKQKRIY